MTITIAEILRIITDCLLFGNIIGLCLLCKSQQKHIEILESVKKTAKEAQLNKAMLAFRLFLNDLEEAEKVNFEGLERDRWEYKFQEIISAFYEN